MEEIFIYLGITLSINLFLYLSFNSSLGNQYEAHKAELDGIQMQLDSMKAHLFKIELLMSEFQEPKIDK